MSENGMMNLKKYKNVFIETFNVSEDVLDETFTFHDVPIWDSMSHFSLIANLEEQFDVMFESKDVLHFGSYLNGIEILKRYGVDFT